MAACLVSGLSACATARNYPDPSGPRFAGAYAGQPRPRVIRVVSFNVKYARRIAGAVQLFRYDPRLSGADVIALQEMDEGAVEALARALSLNYVYYPAVLHPKHRKNMGNAILSPWPIRDDLKLVLPHRNRFRDMQRIAVAATVMVDGALPLRAYSVHLETPAGIGSGGRRDQARAVLDSARGFERVVIAGDFNGKGLVREVFEGNGFAWLTKSVGRTISRFSWDHVVARGLKLRDLASVGTAPQGKVSDHRPVWAELVLE